MFFKIGILKNFEELGIKNRYSLKILQYSKHIHYNGIRSHNHLVRKQALSHLAKLVKAKVTKWLGLRLQTKGVWPVT